MVPMSSPDSVSLTQTRRPGEHRRMELDPDGVTKKTQTSLGILQDVTGVDYRRNFAALLADPIKNFRLRLKTQVFQSQLFVFSKIRGDDFCWITNQKTIGQFVEPVPIHFRQQMMSHMFLIKDPRGGLLVSIRC